MLTQGRRKTNAGTDKRLAVVEPGQSSRRLAPRKRDAEVPFDYQSTTGQVPTAPSTAPASSPSLGRGDTVAIGVVRPTASARMILPLRV